MSEQTAKPYLVRAIYEWCSDQGFTPYLAVRVNAQTRVPQGFVKNGEIVLNISATATRHLKIDNDSIRFSARFNGVSHEVHVPLDAVAGIFARETGYGFAFAVGTEGVEQTAPVQASPAAPFASGGRVPVGVNNGSAGRSPGTAKEGKAGTGAKHHGAASGAKDVAPGPDRPRGRPNLQVIK